MKAPVTDAAVDAFVGKLRAGVPTGEVFPTKMSDCDFTPAQREKIRKARADRKAALKDKPPAVPAPQVVLAPEPKPAPKSQLPVSKSTPAPAMSKFGKMLYLQGGTCFFCGRPLAEKDASIEHLNPKSRGGTNAKENLVACHRSLNQVFGDMDLKRKFEFVLKTRGAFRCPST